MRLKVLTLADLLTRSESILLKSLVTCRMKLYLYPVCEKQNASTDSSVPFSQLTFQIKKETNNCWFWSGINLLTNKYLVKVTDDWFAERISQYIIHLNIWEYAKLILLKTPMLSLLVIREKHTESSAQARLELKWHLTIHMLMKKTVIFKTSASLVAKIHYFSQHKTPNQMQH